MDRNIQPPLYVQQQPERDVRCVFPCDGAAELRVNVLKDWPKERSLLDESQMEALKRIMTRGLAVVQVS